MKRAGIVGCGGISAVHAKVLSGMEGVTLAACADIRPERAQALAAQHGARAYASLADMLDKERLDAIHLCTPHWLHPSMAAEAARRGVAVFTEKPPAIDRAGWAQVKEAASRVPVGVCFQNRYNANVLACENILAGGVYGGLRGIRAFVTWQRGAGYYTDTDWKGRWDREGGGALMNQAVHTLDLAVRFLGKPDAVEATLRNHHLRGVIEVEDTAEIWLRRGERTVLLYATTAYTEDAPVLMELQLEGAVLRLEDGRLEVRRQGSLLPIPCDVAEGIGRSYWGAGHRTCIEDFYRCMATGQPYKNRPAACEDTMQALFAVYEQNHACK